MSDAELVQELTEEQKCEILREFKERVKDLKFHDGMVLRFLKARQYDLEKAEEMIRASAVWRKEEREKYFGQNFYQWEPPAEILAGFDIYYCGKDFEGRPVYYAPLGIWASARDLFAQGFEDDCLRYAGKGIEKVHKFLLETKHQNFVCIVDNDGLSYSKILYEMQNLAGIQDLIKLFCDYEANYPETLHKAFVINTPYAFYMGFNIVKPFLTQSTLSRIEFPWYPDYKQHMPIETIPVKLGGKGKMQPFWSMEYGRLTSELDTAGPAQVPKPIAPKPAAPLHLPSPAPVPQINQNQNAEDDDIAALVRAIHAVSGTGSTATPISPPDISALALDK